MRTAVVGALEHMACAHEQRRKPGGCTVDSCRVVKQRPALRRERVGQRLKRRSLACGREVPVALAQLLSQAAAACLDLRAQRIGKIKLYLLG